jgi:hypothetical protein
MMRDSLIKVGLVGLDGLKPRVRTGFIIGIASSSIIGDGARRACAVKYSFAAF